MFESILSENAFQAWATIINKLSGAVILCTPLQIGLFDYCQAVTALGIKISVTQYYKKVNDSTELYQC